MDINHFKAEMDRLDLAYSQDSNAGKRLIYWQRLNIGTDEQFTEAVNRILETERFYPSIATIHGTIEAVRREWRNAYLQAAGEPERFSVTEPLLPACTTCLDSGWYTVPSPHSNQPGTLTKCDCGAAITGMDGRFHRNQHSAVMYLIERDHARFPAYKEGATDAVVDPARAAADLADRLAMDRRS
jgi:hypothetical protein